MMEQGGILMWPLLALSIATLAVVFDRLIAFSTLRLWDAAMEDRILSAAAGRDAGDPEEEDQGGPRRPPSQRDFGRRV